MTTSIVSTWFLGSALTLSAANQGAASTPTIVEEHFPASTALAEGLSPQALERLDQLVQSLVDDEEVVGAELLVIKNGNSVLHEAYGMRDKEAALPMEKGRVYCVRSMTKPLIGTSILMLVDDRKLSLGDRVAEYLPAFDAESTRDITIEQLLNHTSGLPMSLIMAKDPRKLEGGIQAVAQLGAGTELAFEPGSAFNYSDQGTDTLTAVIEVVSGMSAAEFVRTRVLDPLGMSESACVMSEDHPLRERGLVAYAGSRGHWNRFWGPDDEALFPFFLGSQGLYSTIEDYARFTEFWWKRGRAGTERLLGMRYMRKALTPGPYPMGEGGGFAGLRSDYGYLMQLWTRARDGDESKREVVLYGHTGSDGTHAWVFPEQDAMVLYFTQSRQNTTGLRVMECLGELFLGTPYDSNQDAPPFEEYMGYYWEGEGDLYRAIIRDGDDLALEIMGKAIVPLTYVGEDRWKFRPNPSVVLQFERAESGEVTGYSIGDHQEYRFEPSQELPDVDELVERVASAHRLDLLETLGPLRLKGELKIESLGVEGEFTSVLAWPDRYCVDSVVGEEFERLVVDGKRVVHSTKSKEAVTFEGQAAELLSLDTPLVRYGDWHRSFTDLQVIQKFEGPDDEQVFLVRGGDLNTPGVSMYVHGETGRLVHLKSMTYMDAVGRVGRSIDFNDYRDLSGMSLPFQIEYELAIPNIGTIVTTVTDFELSAELPEGAFE